MMLKNRCDKMPQSLKTRRIAESIEFKDLR